MSNFSGGGGGGLPAGGLVGQAVFRQSPIPGDSGWQYPPDLPTILTPIVLGANAVTSNVVVAIVTGADSPAGATIVIAGMQAGAGNIASVSDGTANVYTPIDNGGGNDCCSFECENALFLSSGSTITVTFTNATNNAAAAISLPGVAATSLDVSGKNGNSGGFAGGATSVKSTGALAQPNEILIGILGSSFRNGSPITIPSGWTGLAFAHVGAGNDVFVHVSSLIVYDQSSRDFQGSFGTNCNWAIDLLSFKGA